MKGSNKVGTQIELSSLFRTELKCSSQSVRWFYTEAWANVQDALLLDFFRIDQWQASSTKYQINM